MLSKIKQAILKQDFNPGLLGLLVNPFYFARRGLSAHLLPLLPHVTGKTLDIGCGQKPYEPFTNAQDYIGLEVEVPNTLALKKVDVVYSGKCFPFASGSFDSLITNQVLEHVFEPHLFLTEMNRVLKKEGTLLLTVPFVWDEHEQPYDYARYSSFGLRHVLQKHGFEIVHHAKSMNDIRVIFQLLNGYLYKKTVTRNGYLNLAVTLLLMAPLNILGQLLSYVLPKNDDLYLDNIVLAKKVKEAS